MVNGFRGGTRREECCRQANSCANSRVSRRRRSQGGGSRVYSDLVEDVVGTVLELRLGEVLVQSSVEHASDIVDCREIRQEGNEISEFSVVAVGKG